MIYRHITLGVIARFAADSYRCMINDASRWLNSAVVVVDDDPDLGIDGYMPEFVRYFHRANGGDLGAQRNFAVEMADTEWILFLDTDERPTEGFWKKLGEWTQGDTDLVMVPRLNLVVDHPRDVETSLCIWPDPQPRLHRTSLRWRGTVHSHLDGVKRCLNVEADESLAIIHRKTYTQALRNHQLFNTFGTKEEQTPVDLWNLS